MPSLPADRPPARAGRLASQLDASFRRRRGAPAVLDATPGSRVADAGLGRVGGGGQVAMVTAERIRGRQVSIDIDKVPGIGWVAIGIVKEGLGPEKGMRFEVRAEDRSEAERRLKMEIEAALA